MSKAFLKSMKHRNVSLPLSLLFLSILQRRNILSMQDRPDLNPFCSSASKLCCSRNFWSLVLRSLEYTLATTLQGIPGVLVLKDISHIIYSSWDNHWSMIIKFFSVVENLTVWRMIILKEVTLKKGIIFFLKKWTNTWRMNFTIQEDGRRKLYKIFHMWELWWYNSIH